MKESRKFAAVMSAVIAFSAFSQAVPAVSGIIPVTVASAAEEASSKETEDLKKAITEVKKRINIPKELDQFKYDTNVRYGTNFYTLKWYKETTEKRPSGAEYTRETESITVSFFNGYISRYYHARSDQPDYGKPMFAKLTPEKQQEFAEKYLTKLNPGFKGNAVFKRETSDQSLTERTVSFYISREENGIPVSDNRGRIVIDRDTGELVEYSLKWWSDADIPAPKDILSVEKVSEIYKERKGLKAYYNIFRVGEYDKETGEYKYNVFASPVYVPVNYGQNEIDAFTGKYTAIYDDKKKYSYTDAYDWSGYIYSDGEVMEEAEYEYCDEEAAYDDVELNEAEIKALETENSYISYENMLKIIKDDPFIVFNDKLILSSKRLSTSTDYNGNVKNEWVMSFRYSTSKDTEDSISLSVRADAVTGEIITFSKSYSYGKNSPNKLTKKADRTAVRKRADEAGKHFLGERFSEYRCDGIPETTRQDTSINVRYTRYVNDLPVPADTLNIRVDSNNEVLGFSYTYHDLKFPEAKLVGEDKAYEKLFENMKPELTYEGFADLQLKPHIYLTYTFDSDFTINALTGERVTYENKPYYTEETVKASEDKEIKYTDIGGYKYEDEINTLLAYGIYITDSDKLDPNGAITIGEFNRVSSILGKNFSSYYSVYINGNYDKEATMKKMNKKLTRQELAMIYLRLFKSDYAAAAGVQGVFKSYYSDVPESSPYCGYITLARASGLIKAKDGKFDPNGTLTRGEVLHILYTYLLTDKESELYELYSL